MIVLRMGANPKPKNGIFYLRIGYAKSPVIYSGSNGPKLTDPLEL